MTETTIATPRPAAPATSSSPAPADDRSMVVLELAVAGLAIVASLLMSLAR